MPTKRRAAAGPRSEGRVVDDQPNVGALLDALRAVARELRVAEREAEQLVGLHPAQLHTLRQLAGRPAGSLAELAERTHTDPSSASVVVQRLVERGLVERTEATDDRRRTQLGITAAGRAQLRRQPLGAADRLADAKS
ncbi:MarR family transcriptional regulator, partial [Roseisolibacter sp. H3M3-2]|uniref:MarR family winged helix-turn-helix transcriptional regulator n=1 Tax=Roseisolibacter sp. H3M3-2 TaxID=3031323 RepID=UPI0023DA9CD6